MGYLCRGFAKSEKKKKKPNLMPLPPVILGPEMAAPILWTPGIFWFFLLEIPMPIKFVVLGGGGVVGFLEGGGGSANFIRMVWGFFRQKSGFQKGGFGG